jgi:hypothetical protein
MLLRRFPQEESKNIPGTFLAVTDLLRDEEREDG